MRGRIEGLASSVPFAPRLPAVLQDDEFLMRFLLAFDDAMAPVFSTLDGLDAYIDPRLAPRDFLLWIAEWVGAEVDQSDNLEQQRSAVAAASSLHRRRGTVDGMRDAVRRVVPTGEVVVEDNGGVRWSQTTGAAFPGVAEPGLHVIISNVPTGIDLSSVDRVVAATKPAHVPHSVEVAGDTPANMNRGNRDDGSISS